MLLNGEEIALNDRVFDVSVSRGFGRVKLIAKEHFEVQFDRLSVNYTSDGIQIGKNRQTLYWNRPLVIAPTKNEAGWEERRGTIDNFFKMMSKYIPAP